MIFGDFLGAAYDGLLEEMRVNVETHLALTRHFGQRLVTRGRGGILLVSSTAGLQPVPFIANYAAAKAYVLTLGEAVHHELATLVDPAGQSLRMRPMTAGGSAAG